MKKDFTLGKDNKGFSLVELIIVIAIMAILSAALAPQLMKYIQRSRESTDHGTMVSLKNTVNAVLSESHVHKDCYGKTITLEFAVSDDLDSASSVTSSDDSELLRSELKDKISDIQAPKQSDKTKWKVTITSTGTDGLLVDVDCI